MKRGRGEDVSQTLLDMGCSSLLESLRVDDAFYSDPAIKAYLFAVREMLISLPSKKIDVVSHMSAFPSLPLRRYSMEARSLDFSAPSRVDVVGGFILRTLVRPALTVDLAVELPCISSRDIKNHIWNDKRAMFLGELASGLSESGLCLWVKCEAPQGDPGRPCLLLRPCPVAVSGLLQKEEWGSYSEKNARSMAKALAPVRIRIYPVLPPVGLPFTFSTLRPSWNNVRSYTFSGAILTGIEKANIDAGGEGEGKGSMGDADMGEPTPFYNSCIMSDIGARWFSSAAHEALTITAPVSRDVIIALKAWARRRGWHRVGEDSVSSTLLTALVVYLVQTGKILATMSLAQALSTTFSFLGGKGVQGKETDWPNWVNNPIVLATVASSQSSAGEDIFNPSITFRAPTKSLISEFKSVSPTGLLVLCPSGLTNFASHLSPWALSELIRHSRVASSALEVAVEGDSGRFESLWSTVITPSLQYDRICTLPLPPSPIKILPAYPNATFPQKGGAHALDISKKKVDDDSPPRGEAPTTLSPPIAVLNALCNHATWGRVVIEQSTKLLTKALSDRISSPPAVFLVYTTAAAAPATVTTTTTSSKKQPEAASPPSILDSLTQPTTSTTSIWPLPEPFVWSLKSSAPSPSCAWVCLSLHAASTGSSSGTTAARPSHRMVEKGPSPESVNASKEWVDLWGPNVSSLRRFGDGSIRHACVWDGAALGGRSHARDALVPLIAAHVLERHLGVKLPCGILHVGDVLTVEGGSETVGGGGDDGKAAQTATTTSASASAAASAAALFYADVGNFCPSVALEKVLDPGGHIPTASRLRYTTITTSNTEAGAGAGGAFHSTMLSPITGFQTSLDGGVGGRIPPLLPLSPPLSGDGESDNKGKLNLSAVSITAFPVGGLVSGASTNKQGSSSSKLTSAALSAAALSDPLAKGPHTAFATALVALDAAIAALKSVGSSLPLRVLSCKHTSPALRYTSLHPPAPHPFSAGERRAALNPEEESHHENSLLSSLPTSTQLISIAKCSASSALAAILASPASAQPSPHYGPLQQALEPVVCQTINPLCAVLTLERSSKWPSDPTALTALKTAFYLKLQYAVNSASSGGGAANGTTAAVPKRTPTLIRATARPHCLDLALGGYLFRFTIALEWELKVLARLAGRSPLGKDLPSMGKQLAGRVGEARGELPLLQHKPESQPKKAARKAVEAATGISVGSERMSKAEMSAASARIFSSGVAESREARVTAGRNLDALYISHVANPQHAAFIHSVALTYPAFSPALRLAVHWLLGMGLGGCVDTGDDIGAAVMLGEGGEGACVALPPSPFPYQAIELCMAYVFTSPHPYTSPPGTPTLGFLRWLGLLASHDWLSEPLVIPPPNLSSSATEKDSNNSDIYPENRGGGGGGTLSVPASHSFSLPSPQKRVLMEAFRQVRRGDKSKLDSSSPSSTGLTGAPMYIVVAPPETPGSGEEEQEGGEENGTAGPTPSLRVPWYKPLWTRTEPTLTTLSALVHFSRLSFTFLSQRLCPLATTPMKSHKTYHSSKTGPGGRFPGNTWRGSLHPALSSSGTQLFPDSPPIHPPLSSLLYPNYRSALSSLADTGGSTASATTTLSLPRYHATISIPQRLIPRSLFDGRYMGPVTTPSFSTVSLEHLWEEESENHREKARGVAHPQTLTSSSPDHHEGILLPFQRPQLVLAIPAADRPSLDAAQHACHSDGNPNSDLQVSPPVWTFKRGLNTTLPWLHLPPASMGVSGGSLFSLSLHANLLSTSRTSLLPGFCPMQHFSAALRSRLGKTLTCFPVVHFQQQTTSSTAFSLGVGLVAAKTTAEGDSHPVELAPLLEIAADLGVGLIDSVCVAGGMSDTKDDGDSGI